MKFISLLLLTLLLTGCETFNVGKGYIRKDIVTSQLEQIKNEKEKELNVAVQRVIKAKDAQREQIEFNFQQAANYVFGASYGLELMPNRDRLWNITYNRVQVAASYAPAPTKEALIEQVKTLKEELDTTKVSNEELAAKYNQKIEEANEATKLQEELKLKVQEKENELIQKEREFNDLILSKQNELNELNDKLLAAEQENSENKEYIEANKRWLMAGAAIIGTICLLGAIFSPIFKKECGIGAAAFGAIAISIPFVQPIHILIAFIVLFLTGIIWFLRKSGTIDRTNSNLINAIHEVRENEPEVYKVSIKERLRDWNSKYKKVKGKIVKVKDDSVDNLIEEKLVKGEKI